MRCTRQARASPSGIAPTGIARSALQGLQLIGRSSGRVTTEQRPPQGGANDSTTPFRGHLIASNGMLLTSRTAVTKTPCPCLPRPTSSSRTERRHELPETLGRGGDQIRRRSAGSQALVGVDAHPRRGESSSAFRCGVRLRSTISPPECITLCDERILMVRVPIGSSRPNLACLGGAMCI